MKKTILLVLALLFSLSIFAQKRTKADTLICKTVLPSAWSLQFDMGAAYMPLVNSQFTNNQIGVSETYKIGYKNFFFKFGILIMNSEPSKNLSYNAFSISNQTNISCISGNYGFGYLYNFSPNWSAEAKIGRNSTQFDLEYNNYDTYKTNYYKGSTYGIGFSRYFKLNTFNYIVASLGADYYVTNLSKLSPDMNDNSTNFHLTVAYKGFFKKIMK